jgi:hypothetical protein
MVLAMLERVLTASLYSTETSMSMRNEKTKLILSDIIYNSILIKHEHLAHNGEKHAQSILMNMPYKDTLLIEL